MGERPGEMNSSHRSTEDIRRDIARTQREMSSTIDEIQYRLSPDHLKQQTKESIRRAGVNTSRGIADKVKSNPLGAAMVGVGLWLMFRDNDDHHDDYDTYAADYNRRYAADFEYDSPRIYSPQTEYRDFEYGHEQGRGARMKEKASDMMDSAQDRVSGALDSARDRVSGAMDSASESAHDLADRAGERARMMRMRAMYGARRARSSSRDLLSENPLVAGLAAAAFGAIIGAMIPESEREHELFGETRDRLADRAKDVARSGAQHAKDIATAAATAATDAAKQETKTAKEQMKQDLRTT
jgi:hypothetical protein